MNSNSGDWHFSKKSFQSFEGLNSCNLEDKIIELLQIYIHELKRTLYREGARHGRVGGREGGEGEGEGYGKR